VAQNRGMALCEQGDAQRGVLWLARSLEILPGDSSDLRRLNLSGWCRRLCSLTAFQTLPGAVMPLGCDPGGKFLLTGDADGNARLWEAATGKPIGQVPLQRGVVVSAFSPDGKIVLSGDDAGSVGLWKTANGELLCRLPEGQGKVVVAALGRD